MNGSRPIEKVAIPSPNGFLAGALHLPSRVPAPVIICSHGLLSSKNGSKFIAIGEAFSLAGWAVLRFDFAGCGDSDALPRRELVQSRLADLNAVIHFAWESSWSRPPMGLLGSSMGGYISLLAAAVHRDRDTRINGVVCWATPYDLKEIHPDETKLETLAQVFPRGFKLGEPDILDELPPISGGLIIHGQMDEIVPWQHAPRIFHCLAEPRRLCLMKTADHSIVDPQWRYSAIKMSREWLRSMGF